MFTSRSTKLILIAVLIVAVVIATYEVIHARPVVQPFDRGSSYVGMGDVHRYEAQQALNEAKLPGSDHPYIGMGDLRRYEFLQNQESAGQNISP